MDQGKNITYLALGGEWVITVISQQLQCLVGHRSTLLAAMAGQMQEGSVTVDLSRVESLDATGCQLLASFMKVIEKDGLKPGIAAMPASFQELFDSLGYNQTPKSGD